MNDETTWRPLIRVGLDPHEFQGSGHDCALCGEGICYYLHTDRPAYQAG